MLLLLDDDHQCDSLSVSRQKRRTALILYFHAPTNPQSTKPPKIHKTSTINTSNNITIKTCKLPIQILPRPSWYILNADMLRAPTISVSVSVSEILHDMPPSHDLFLQRLLRPYIFFFLYSFCPSCLHRRYTRLSKRKTGWMKRPLNTKLLRLH